MPGSPYLDERPPGLLTWPLLLPILLTVFLTEVIVGAWIWLEIPEWRIFVYAMLGIDLLVLVVFFVLTTRASAGDE